MSRSGKVGISASKVVALIGSLILIADSVRLITTIIGNSNFWYNVLFGILGIVGALIIIISLRIIEIPKINIPYEWWILLLVGGLMLLFYALGGGMLFLTGSIVIIIAGILELLSEKKKYVASQFVAWIGAGLTILFSILSGNIISIIIGVICGVLLILALIDEADQIPFSWWVVLILGFIVFTWADPIGGTVILIAFVLILMSY